MLNGAILIAKERVRQIIEEGWTAEHDQQHQNGEIALAAMIYACPPWCRDQELIDDVWPWDKKWWKPTPDDRITELKKAGALIAAEIDRLLAEQGELTNAD